MKLLGLVVIVAAVACGKSKADCNAQVDDLMKLLRGIDHSPSLFMIDDDMHLVERAELPKSDLVSAPVVVIKAATVDYQGQLVADAADLHARLAESYRKIQSDVDDGRVPRHWTWDHRIYFEIDAGAKWGTVAAMVDAAGDVGFVPHFVFALPVKLQRPPRAPIDDELDRLVKAKDDGNKATKLAEMMSKQIASCPAMKKVFGAVGSEEGGDKAAELIEGIGPALVDCKCDVDMASFRSSMYRVLANEHPTSVLAVAVGHDAPPLELPAATPWKEAAGKLAPGAKAWLVAK